MRKAERKDTSVKKKNKNNIPDSPKDKSGISIHTFRRIIQILYESYPKLIPLTAFCIVFSAIVNAVPSIFVQKILAVVTECLENGLSSGAAGIDWSEASGKIIPLIIALIVLYILSIISMTIYSQLMAVITQGFLSKLRCRMFDGMQNLPIGYFDTHKHGDIMSLSLIHI